MANAFKEKLRRDEVVVVLNPDHPSKTRLLNSFPRAAASSTSTPTTSLSATDFRRRL